MPMWGSVYFQEGVSPVMEQLIFFHDHTMMVMLAVMVVVGYLLGNSIYISLCSREVVGGQGIETVWTIVPAIILLFIAFPSLRLLYLMEEGGDVDLTVKVVGHQWYWSYEVFDVGVDEFDSYMLKDGDFRLLDVDNELVVPMLSNIRMLVTSGDVIHSWTVPSLGVSTDAVPGRLNQIFFWFNRPGWFMGQCSEICGANHSFMPIFISVVSREDFLGWWD